MQPCNGQWHSVCFGSGITLRLLPRESHVLLYQCYSTSLRQPVTERCKDLSTRPNEVIVAESDRDRVSVRYGRAKPTSKRAHKRRTGSPSALLFDVLRDNHLSFVLPAFFGRKIDLSYENAWRTPPDPRKNRRQVQTPPQNRSHNARLQQLLLRYIQSFLKKFPGAYSNPEWKKLEDGFVADANENMDLKSIGTTLASKCYNWQDIQLWHHILVSSDDIAMSRELLAHANVPLPVILLFLRRPKLDQESLRNVLTWVWSRAKDIRHDANGVNSVAGATISKEGTAGPGYHMDRSSMLILIVRLLRHARQAMPEAMVTIARLFLTIPTFRAIQLETGRKRSRHLLAAARVSFTFNKVLKLLSLPSRVNPFHSVIFMQRAQFDVLNFMAHHEPMIQLNREGYQAVAQIQLANKKNLRERDWASLKAKTWPPWKEDKMGFDVEKGPEYGISQAFQAIQRGREAGYASEAWEKVTTILAGWDVDQSPTIQTRAFNLHRQLLRRSSGSNEHLATPMWAARIKSTRNVQEAWASFLAYEDDVKGKIDHHSSVYMSVFEKIHYEHQRARGEDFASRDDYARNPDYGGDAKEVGPVSESPKEQTYVRSPPPTMDELANQMFTRVEKPSQECFAFLIANAHTFSNGVKYLRQARQHYPSVDALFTSEPHQQSEVLRSVPLKLFEAFIKFLCRNAKLPNVNLLTQNARYPCRISQGMGDPPVFLAYRFLKSRKGNSQSMWYMLAYRLMTSPLPDLLRAQISSNTDLEMIERWGFIRSIRRQMRDNDDLRLNGSSFILFNRVLSTATLSAYRVRLHYVHKVEGHPQYGSRSSYENDRPLAKADSLIKTSAKYARGMFHELFGDDSSGSIKGEVDDLVGFSGLLATPLPPILHAYVRSLGLLRDWNGLRSLAQWMSIYSEEINTAAERSANGPEMLRKTIVALRVFLEQAWLTKYHCDHVLDSPSKRVDRPGGTGYCQHPPSLSENECTRPETAAPREIFEDIRLIIQRLEEWGGWPSDQEVNDYCDAGEFPKQ